MLLDDLIVPCVEEEEIIILPIVLIDISSLFLVDISVVLHEEIVDRLYRGETVGLMELVSPECGVVLFESHELIVWVIEVIQYPVGLVPRAIDCDDVLHSSQRRLIEIEDSLRPSMRVKDQRSCSIELRDLSSRIRDNLTELAVILD